MVEFTIPPQDLIQKQAPASNQDSDSACYQIPVPLPNLSTSPCTTPSTWNFTHDGDLNLQEGIPDNVYFNGCGPYAPGINMGDAVEATQALSTFSLEVGKNWPHDSGQSEPYEINTNTFTAPPTMTADSNADTEDDEARTLLTVELANVPPASPTMTFCSSSTLKREASNYSFSNHGSCEGGGGAGEQCISPRILQRNSFVEEFSSSPQSIYAITQQNFTRQHGTQNSILAQGESFHGDIQYTRGGQDPSPSNVPCNGQKSSLPVVPCLTGTPAGRAEFIVSSQRSHWQSSSCKSNSGNRSRKATVTKNQGVRSKRPLKLRCADHNKTFSARAQYHKHMATAHPRPFICDFFFAGCSQQFGSKNEWKRHVESQHIQSRAWICDFEACMVKPAIFNRKDLFGQHLKRMHSPLREQHESKKRGDQTLVGTKSKKQSKVEQDEFLKSIPEIQERCVRKRRDPPRRSRCLYCEKEFESWEARMEDMGKHYESVAGGTRGKKGGSNTKPGDLPPPKLDMWVVEWALAHGIIEYGGANDKKGGPVETDEMANETKYIPQGYGSDGAATSTTYRLVPKPRDPLNDSLEPSADSFSDKMNDDDDEYEDEDDYFQNFALPNFALPNFALLDTDADAQGEFEEEPQNISDWNQFGGSWLD